MASIIADTHGTHNFISTPRSQAPSESEKGYRDHNLYPSTANSSQHGLFKYHSIYNAANKRNHEFKTYLVDSKIDKPWLGTKEFARPRKGNWLIIAAFILAIILSGIINWRVAVGVPKHDYCLVLDDKFESLDPSIWTHEVQLDGFGNDAFDWTTTDPKNAFTDEEGLHIVPTLTTETTDITEDQLNNGYTLDLTGKGDGSCTADTNATYYTQECTVRSNAASNGTHTIIPPIRSARLTTQGSASILYGRVEVVAKVPKGDWLWPAIWMMPKDSVYGIWPQSGEIDIMESRGNARGYKSGGREYMSSTLHWGPSWRSDAWRRTTQSHLIQRTDYSDDFHTFGMEWSKDYLYTWVDNRLQQVIYVDFTKKNLWQTGKFEGQYENGTLLTNPWYTSENSNAPFDEKFFLILNVAVGGRNGYFPDGIGSKPWVDGKASAASDFYAAKSQWEPTWGKGSSNGMTVKSVKMWQQGKCPS